MYQGAARRLFNHFGSSHVRKVASLLAEPLSHFRSHRLTRQLSGSGGPRWFPAYLPGKLPPGWAGSSVAEQGTFNPRVEGSIPSRLTEATACTDGIPATIQP